MKTYTDKEMIKQMDALFKEGKSPFEILKDPKCKPNVREKLYKLYDILLDHHLEQKEAKNEENTNK